MSAIVHYKSNLSPSLADTIKVNGVAFDLTGCTVKFRMRSARSSTLKVDAAAVITNAAGGAVRYDWQAADVDTPEFYVGWWQVTLTNGKTQDSDEFLLELRDHGPGAGYLCTLDQARLYLQKPDTDRTQDSVILQCVGAASKAIMAHCEREFAPTSSGLARTFDFRPRPGRVIDLAPYDLRTVTSMKLNPEDGASAITLVAGTDYVLEPIGAESGTFYQVRLSRYLTLSSNRLQRFGSSQLEITGNWGFAAVPLDVEHWCKVQVWVWMRREVQSFSSSFSIDEARLERPEALASAVRKGVERFMRNQVLVR